MGNSDHPTRILAVKLRAIGDTVIWTSALQGLRQAMPDAEIHVLTYASNAGVLAGLRAVDECHWVRPRSSLALVSKLMSLRAHHFSWLLGFHAAPSLCRWAWVAGAQQVALHNHSLQATPPGSVEIPHAGVLEDAITRDWRVLEAIGYTGPHLPTKIELTSAEREAAEARVRAAINECGGNTNLPRYAFLPGAGHALRRYPKELWLPQAENLRKLGRYQPVVVVDQALSREWNLPEECRQRGLPLIDRGSLREFVSLVGTAGRSLANDSGPGHISVALGLHTSFVFGPGCVGDWHPYDRTQNPLFRLPVPCRAQGPRDLEQFQFCTVDTCSHHRCLRELQVELS